MAMYVAHKLALILSAIAIVVPQTANAKSAPLSKSWAGTWHLNMEKSKFSSEDFTPKSDTRTYTAAGNHLTMRSTMVNAAGKTIKWGYSASTDGKPYRTTGNPYTDHVVLMAVGPHEFTSKALLKGKPVSKSTVTLSTDGKLLTIKRSMLTAKGGPTHDTMLFDRTK
jgi:hypothetical protein